MDEEVMQDEVHEEVVEQEEEVVEPEVEESEPEEAPRVSRAQARIQALASERDAERQRAAAAEERARLLEEQTRLEMNRRQQEADWRRQQEEEANLPYDQQLYRHQQRFQAQMEQQMRMTQAQLAEQTDRLAFESKAVSDTTYRKYAERVEKERQAYAAKGQIVPREVILKYLIGEDALSQKGKSASERKKSEAASRVQNARGTPVRARSDVGGSGRQRIKSLEERLENQPL